MTKKQLIQEFLLLLEEYPDELEDLNILWEFLRARPDIILDRLCRTPVENLGEIKNIQFVDNNRKLKIVSQIDAGFARNWDGSGCEGKETGELVEQHLTISCDGKRYSNYW